jgi:hypothetical protein
MLLVTLDFWIVNFAANQAFGVKYSVFRVRMESILGGVTNTTRTNARLERRYSTVDEQEKGRTGVPRRRMRPMKE